jgi:hypothetical protein
MEIVFGLLGLGIAGALVTAAARFALPGPDPMPIWLMSVIGALALIVGGGIGYGLADAVGALLGAIVFATLILVAYRRFVQRRGITGPDAQRLPTRGVGIRKLRRRWGIETAPTAETEVLLSKLGDLRDGGALTSEEYELLEQSLGGRRS